MNNQAKRNQLRAKLLDQHTQSSRSKVWWVWGYTKRGGKPVVKGWWPLDKEREAQRWAYTYTNGNYDLYALDTTSQPAATSKIKSLRQEVNKIDLDEALQRVRHKGKDINIE